LLFARTCSGQQVCPPYRRFGLATGERRRVMEGVADVVELEDDPPYTAPPHDVDKLVVPAVGHGVHHEALVDVHVTGDGFGSLNIELGLPAVLCRLKRLAMGTSVATRRRNDPRGGPPGVVLVPADFHGPKDATGSLECVGRLADVREPSGAVARFG
jgi:hypothetical protein